MRIRKIFTIDLQHEYFSTSLCRDLDIIPGPDAKVLFKKHRLYFRYAANKLIVFIIENEEGGLTGHAEDDLEFSFLIFLKDITFLEYTTLPEKGNDEIFCFTNTISDNEEASTLHTDVIKRALVQSTQDLRLLGVIRITSPGRVFYTAGHKAEKKFTLHFKASGIYWKYYILVNGSRKQVEVDGSLAGIEFEPGDDVADPTRKSIAGNFPNDQLVVYTSRAEVAFRDAGVKNIRLLNAENKSVLVSHLPTPRFSDRGIKIINAGML